MKRKKWTMPAWMTPYVPMLANTGGDWILPEHAMNCDSKNCNLAVNGPRALLCAGVQSQVILLQRLHEKGLLVRP
jgi:hypothetical protein